MKLLITFSLLLIPKTIYAQSGTDLIPKWEVGIEYYSPTSLSRDIQTISMNFLYGWERTRKFPLTLGGGITLTHAWGSIIQLDDNLNDVEFENSASGIGPIFCLKYELLRFQNWSVAPDFLGGVLLYSEKFPAGGDIYNFMWRLGGMLTYKVPESSTSLGISYRWMHVSNGQGLTPKNPSYEGAGVGFSFIKYL